MNIFGVAEWFASIFRAFCRAYHGDYFEPLITQIRPLILSSLSRPFSTISGFVPDVFRHHSTRVGAQSKALDNSFPSPPLAYQRVRSFLRYSLFRHYIPFAILHLFPFQFRAHPWVLSSFPSIFVLSTTASHDIVHLLPCQFLAI